MLKDEASNIHFMLDRYQPKPAIVAVNINNTTDNTREVLTEYCAKHGIKLYIKESKFYNYAENRNIAMETANAAIRSFYGICPTGPISKEESILMEKNDDIWYTHMVDADNLTLDDNITGVTDENMDTMDLGTVNIARCINASIPKGKKDYPDSFDMTILSSSKYVVNNLFRMHLNGYNGIVYMCCVHEVPTPKCWNMTLYDLKGCYIKRGQRGARSRDGLTYMKDAMTITHYLNEGRVVPGDKPRMTYYCAQSYKDARLHNEAITYFHKRAIDERGYHDERFMAYLNLSQLIGWIRIDGQSPYTAPEVELKKLEFISNAHELIPYRWDAMVPLFRFYYQRKLYKLAWTIAKPYARMYDVPKGLFVDKAYYESVVVLEEFVLAASHAGDKDTARDILNHISKLPAERFKTGEYDRIMAHRSLL
jgi:hypothetical protein